MTHIYFGGANTIQQGCEWNYSWLIGPQNNNRQWRPRGCVRSAAVAPVALALASAFQTEAQINAEFY